MKNILTIISLLLITSACSSPTSRYQHENDSKPTRLPSGAELTNAVPRKEAHSRGGNKHYKVRGKYYKVMSSAEGFKEVGIASWYGKKFHGHLTSNGEIYDMYGMSAAHKNLPLPTYLKVTNLQNKRSVIVRVNDRGPFHQDRIIDLSYNAAYQLDMLKTGTATVEIEAITQFSNALLAPPTTAITPENKPYIQVFATRNPELAKSTANALAEKYKENVVWPIKDGIYRIKLGPFKDENTLKKTLAMLRSTGYPKAYRRKLLQ